MDSAELEFVNHSLAVTTLAAQSQEEAENESPSTHSITFDCDGDITLVAGCYRLLVSSKVLTLASPVFRAMLEPGRFREGQTQRNSDNPFTVRLSDDNPESLILLCNLLHYKTIHTPSDIGLLSSFAVICDKYGCTPAMSSHAAFWRCAFDYSSSDMSALLQLLWVAYAFSNKPDFGKLSSKLAAALTTAEVESLQLPDGLPDSIKGSCI
ncbi:hypothetical protein MMC16_001015 [Acarospora aff. strigata]|nr:hypothetical protein [Acarospora aff. strigata]